MSTDIATPIAADAERGKADDQLAGVTRALQVIEWLAAAPEGLSFNEVLRLLDVNKSIVFKILNTLVATQYVFKDDRSGNYCLTYKIANVGMRKMSRSRLLEQSMPILRELADATGEFARLAVVENDVITWVLSALGQQRMLQVDPNYSSEIGLHTHAAGKAWLATLKPAAAQSLVKRHGTKKLTSKSLGTMTEIMADLARTATRGYAVSYEEHALGVGAIGAPVMVPSLSDGTLECKGVITLAAPTAHMTHDELVKCAPKVMKAARRLADIWPGQR